MSYIDDDEDYTMTGRALKELLRIAYMAGVNAFDDWADAFEIDVIESEPSDESR
ncbi:hypothetical protein [Nocardia sp. CC227C]|uniref:hypothetical protein n=1 Tax=Nocardia sp. CC227C TaxID=3044562 RepID=UPI00278BDE27|nr:hypothetical protein [Nocardia sp. CC227C]